MALEHAILVALAEQASTGYELARRFDKSIGQFWTATHQQVYKVLGRMEDTGWVAVTQRVIQDGRADRKTYDVTDAGRAELADWIGRPTDVEVGRSDMAVKIRGVSHGNVKALVAEVERHRARRQERLEYYLESEKRDYPDPAGLRGRRLHQWLVLRGGITLERGLIDWYDDVAAALTRGKGAP